MASIGCDDSLKLNPAVIAIELMLAEPSMSRVAYVDIDAHHADGVEAAFEARPEVLTLSVHESGRYLFPGTGRATCIGSGAGAGSVVDVPLPPNADPACYRLAFQRVVIPTLRAFEPDVIVAQLGADSHVRDPLTHLAQTTAGFCDCVRTLCALADELCSGRLLALGGGGYRPYCETPVMWAAALAVMLELPVPEELPPSWLASAKALATRAGHDPCDLIKTMDHPRTQPDEHTLASTRFAIEQVRRASPLLGNGDDTPS